MLAIGPTKHTVRKSSEFQRKKQRRRKKKQDQTVNPGIISRLPNQNQTYLFLFLSLPFPENREPKPNKFPDGTMFITGLTLVPLPWLP